VELVYTLMVKFMRSHSGGRMESGDISFAMVIKNDSIKRALPHTTKASWVRFFSLSSFLRSS
jgi:hypothetical protein